MANENNLIKISKLLLSDGITYLFTPKWEDIINKPAGINNATEFCKDLLVDGGDLDNITIEDDGIYDGNFTKGAV